VAHLVVLNIQTFCPKQGCEVWSLKFAIIVANNVKRLCQNGVQPFDNWPQLSANSKFCFQRDLHLNTFGMNPEQVLGPESKENNWASRENQIVKRWACDSTLGKPGKKNLICTWCAYCHTGWAKVLRWVKLWSKQVSSI